MDVFDLADNLRAEFQEKGVSNEEFLLKIAETYDIKRVFVSSVADELFDKIPDKRIAEVPEVGMDEAKHLWFAFGIGKILLRDRGLEPSNFDCIFQPASSDEITSLHSREPGHSPAFFVSAEVII